ncbi:MAG: hypothetical protein CL521_04325 [Actinobacteria bacterium]|nr:hypothetical protein [Actinomycetota bacterium]
MIYQAVFISMVSSVLLASPMSVSPSILEEIRMEAKPRQDFLQLPLMLSEKPRHIGPFHVSVMPIRRSGASQYEIGGKYSTLYTSTLYPNPLSRLVFSNDYQGIKCNLRYDINDTQIQVSFAQNQRNQASLLMKDFDWLSDNNKLDIYSESQSNINHQALSISVKQALFQSTLQALYVGASLRFQHYNWEVYDSVEIDYRSNHQVALEGNTLSYELNQYQPSIFFDHHLHLFRAQLITQLNLLLPFAMTQDRDHHRLRDKLTESTQYGSGFYWTEQVHWPLTHHWLATARLYYQYVISSGVQNQYQMGQQKNTWLGSIQESIIGEESGLMVGLTYEP